MAPPLGYPVLLGLLALGGALAGLIAWGIHAHQARLERERQARMALAQRLGLSYEPRPTEDLVGRYGGLQAMPDGIRRYAEHLFRGFHGGVEVRCFDYVYVTQTRDSKGRTTNHYHYVAVAVADLGERYPRLTIVPESWGHKLWDALGGDDIDFESAEFSRRFWVKSDDRKFAYDVLHPRAMEYLLAPGWRHVEVRDGVVALWDSGRVPIDAVESVLDRLVGFIELFPGFLRTTKTGDRRHTPAQAQWKEGWWQTEAGATQRR